EGFRARGGGRAHIFAVRRDQMSEETYNTLLASARVVMHAQNGSLAERLRRSEEFTVDLAARSDGKGVAVELRSGRGAKGRVPGTASRSRGGRRLALTAQALDLPRPSGDDLRFWNGYGGFADDGLSVVRSNGRTTTPHPWINVIAN